MFIFLKSLIQCAYLSGFTQGMNKTLLTYKHKAEMMN